jgi:hypothetical protein
MYAKQNHGTNATIIAAQQFLQSTRKCTRNYLSAGNSTFECQQCSKVNSLAMLQSKRNANNTNRSVPHAKNSQRSLNNPDMHNQKSRNSNNRDFLRKRNSADLSEIGCQGRLKLKGCHVITTASHSRLLNYLEQKIKNLSNWYQKINSSKIRFNSVVY